MPPLLLPRQLVNKILAHAQQHASQQTCGLISEDTQKHYFFYPLPVSPVSTACAHCFEENNPAFNNLQTQLASRQQTLLACVFSAKDNSPVPAEDNGMCSQDPCYYIITSLNTKGVIDMQAYYRDKLSLQKIELALLIQD